MNSKAHLYISLLKSVIRIGSAFVTILTNDIKIIAIGFIIAEIGGILEEIFDKR